MEVEVVTPDDYMGDVIGDLNRRRARSKHEPRGTRRLSSAAFRFRKCSGTRRDALDVQGRAIYTMQFDHYEEAPRNIAEEVISRAKGLR